MKTAIFIIDDDPIYRMIAAKMLCNFDASIKIIECANGEIGLDHLKQIKNACHQIIILLDINMQQLDGWFFLEELERHDFYNLQHLEIYLVSSSIDDGDLIRSKNFAFVKGFYSKPLVREDIKNIIETV
jgi:CheY-like chemotaxis protein